MTLSEFLAASGQTKDFEDRFEVWVHPPYDDDRCYQIELNLYNMIRYAEHEVIYFCPDYHPATKRLWIAVGIKSDR